MRKFLARFFSVNFDNRYQAFYSHLLLSVVIAGSILAIAKLMWYPNAIMIALGATKVFLLVILVDACFGPVLTFATYNKNKSRKSITLDFSIIIFLQLAALAYGSYTLYAGRPVYYVFSVDRFELVQANDIPQAFLDDEASGEYGRLPIRQAKWLYAELPDDINERNALLFGQIETGTDLAQTPRYYQPLESGAELVREKIGSLNDLRQRNDGATFDDKVIKDLALSDTVNYGFLPLAAKKKDLSIILDRKTLEVIKIVDLYPWPEQ